MENTFWCSMARLQTIVISKYIRRILFLVALVTLLTSCASSYDSLQLIHDCSTRYESVVKTQECAQNAMQNIRRDGATVYASDQGLQSYWNGLVYKVKTNQLSDREAWTRLRNYQVQQNNAARQRTQQTIDVLDGLNCVLYGVACK